MRVAYRHLVSDRDRHGNTRVYFRRGGVKIRIREPLGSREFAERYDELCRRFEAGTLAPTPPTSRAGVRAGTLGALLQHYQMSPDFRANEPSTQRDRERIFASILAEPVRPDAEERYADFPLPRLTTQALAVLRDRKRVLNLPNAANQRVKALRAAFAWAVEHDAWKPFLKTNPAEALKRVRVKTDGIRAWSIEDAQAFAARHPIGTKAHLAMSIMLFTGGRRSDAIRLGRQHVRGHALRWTAYKNRNRHPVTIEIPLLPPLAEALAATKTGDLVWLVNDNGEPYTDQGFGNWFRDRCREAGLPSCSPHGLRKLAATLAAEAGATAHQLMAMFGWTSLAEAERYTQQARRKKMASASADALMQGASENLSGSGSVPLLPSANPGGTK